MSLQHSDDLHDKLVALLSPWEPALMKLQSLLVWENPARSLGFSILVHGVFWYLALSNYSTIFLISSFLLILTCVDLWRNLIWPEIKVPNEFDNEESWVPMHPHLLNIHELADQIISWFRISCNIVRSLVVYRHKKRVPFFILSVSFLTAVAYLGTCISGRILLYIVVTSSLILPTAVYHQVAAHLRIVIGPVLHELEGAATKESEAAEAQFSPDADKLAEMIEQEMAADSTGFAEYEATDLDSLHDFVMKGLDQSKNLSRFRQQRRASRDTLDDSSFEFVDL